jgi:hypothetical protein
VHVISLARNAHFALADGAAGAPYRRGRACARVRDRQVALSFGNRGDGQNGPLRSTPKILAIRTVHLGWSHNHRDVDAIWILMPHDLAIASASLSDLRGGLAPRSSAAEELPIVERGAALRAFAGVRD